MSFLKTIFGPKAKDAEALDTIGEVVAALDRLRAERAAAEDVIATSATRRRALLLDRH